MAEPIKVFISYAHEDDALRQELVGHCKGLENLGLITLWHDRKIMPGVNWDEEIDVRLKQADLILFLVSSALISSNYCNGVELKQALQRHRDQTATVVPIFIRSSYWERTLLSELQGIPRDGIPVTAQGRSKDYFHIHQ